MIYSSVARDVEINTKKLQHKFRRKGRASKLENVVMISCDMLLPLINLAHHKMTIILSAERVKRKSLSYKSENKPLRDEKEKKNNDNFLVKFIICVLHKILFGRQIRGQCDGRTM